MQWKESHKYDDIIHLSRPVLPNRARMTMENRGAQFSPFAALVGYEAVIQETGRQTESKSELDESGKELLDWTLQEIMQRPEEQRWGSFLCFVPDHRKSGGSYEFVSGQIKRVELHRGMILFTDGREIPIESIRDVRE